MITEIWPDPVDATGEPTPLFQKIITTERTPMPLLTPDEDANVEPQEPERIDTGSQNVAGYQKQTQREIDAVNTTKDIENDLGDWLAQLQRDHPDVDKRWVSIARTHFQQGFMALNRAVFQPESRL